MIAWWQCTHWWVTMIRDHCHNRGICWLLKVSNKKFYFYFTLGKQQITYSSFFIHTHGEIKVHFLYKIIQIYFLSIQWSTQHVAKFELEFWNTQLHWWQTAKCFKVIPRFSVILVEFRNFKIQFCAWQIKLLSIYMYFVNYSKKIQAWLSVAHN